MDTFELITGAKTRQLVANGRSDKLVGSDAAEAFVVGNAGTGKDKIVGFGANDSLITKQKLYDSNGDGKIGFGKNGVLDISRTGNAVAGSDQIDFGRALPEGLRYLGTRDGLSAYASASTLTGITQAHGQRFGFDSPLYTSSVRESTIADDSFGFGTRPQSELGYLFIDTALGINTGVDTVTRMDIGDYIVTTSRILNETVIGYQGDGYERMALQDGVLHLPNGGEVHGIYADGGAHTFCLQDIQEVNGVTYYFYHADDNFDA